MRENINKNECTKRRRLLTLRKVPELERKGRRNRMREESRKRTSKERKGINGRRRRKRRGKI